MFCTVASSTAEHTYSRSECFCDSCPPLEPEAWARPQDSLRHSRCGCAPVVPGGLAPTGPFGKTNRFRHVFFYLVFISNRRFSGRRDVLPSHQVWTWGVYVRRGGTGLGLAWVRSRRSLCRRCGFLTTAAHLMQGPRLSLSSRDFSWLRCKGKKGPIIIHDHLQLQWQQICHLILILPDWCG